MGNRRAERFYGLLFLSVALFPWTMDGQIMRHGIDDRIREFGAAVEERWKPHFEKAGVAYPPDQLTLIGLKEEKRLEVYASSPDDKPRWIRSYPILAASGGAGPKLREGDLQVPEGLYRIESLNPNSRFHLSLRVNYPNADDKARAAEEGRTNLGGDIMIHGNAVSIGCLAIGDEAAEDLFVLAALTGIEKIGVILTPYDFRVRQPLLTSASTPAWIGKLYKQISSKLLEYPVAGN